MDDRNRHLRAFVASFRHGTLPRSDWSHESHLIVCWALWRENRAVEITTRELSRLIRAYNARSGQPPDRVACHQTLTRYYVEAVAALDAPSLDGVLLHPWCSRRAPDRHWSPTLLASSQARDRWVEPDLEPLPWTRGWHDNERNNDGTRCNAVTGRGT